MNTALITLSSSAIRHSRIAKDIRQRTTKAFFAYPLLCLAIGLASGWAASHRIVFSVTLIYLTLFSIARMVHLKHLDDSKEINAKRWLQQMRTLVTLHTLGWGCLVAYAMQDINSTMFIYVGMSTAGIIPIATETFAPDKRSSHLTILTMLLPCLVYTLFHSQQWSLVGLLCVYIIAAFLNAKRQNNSYQKMVFNELQLEKLSRTDPLTQIGNRLYFDEQLKRLTNLASRNNSWLSMAIVDCDYFKRINDQYGHDIGDACLIHLAKLLQLSMKRSTDICARFGGEEFVLIFPGMDQQAATQKMDRLRCAIEKTPLIKGSKVVPMTVSIGCVSQQFSHTDHAPVEALLKQADNALYNAKHQGRNCCVHLAFNRTQQVYTSATVH